MKIHFLSFASKRFYQSLNRIEREAKNFGQFDTITCIKSVDLPLAYRLKYIHLLNRFTRGFGYWIWKSFITKKKLYEIEDGDILIYADAGCQINKEGKLRFRHYVQLLSDSKYFNLGFKTPHVEKKYTKGDLFSYFGFENQEMYTNTGQLMATVFMLKKTQETVSLVDDWYTICHHHINLIDDSISRNPNDESFIDHRHDQSVFSLLRKTKGGLFLPDETFFEDWGQHLCFPFHSRRLR